jgi:alpha-glucosidase
MVEIRALRGGMEVRCGVVVTRLTALRDDVIRVQVGAPGLPDADGSWAVAPDSRAAWIPIVAVEDGAGLGFDTGQVKVRMAGATAALTVYDGDGRVILADAASGGVEIRPTGFTLAKAAPADGRYFGLGDKAAPLDRRGRTFTLWNSDTYGFQEGEDPLYKAIPFFLGWRAGRAYGVLLDNTFRSVFDFAQSDPDAIRFGAAGGPIDYYVMAGPTPKDVVSAYAWLTGPAPLPPLWAFGFQQCRYSYMTEAEVRAVARRFREERIPCDVIWLDIDFQDRNRPFSVDTKAFPDLAGMIADLGADGFRVVPITDLHIARTPRDGAYAPYASGMAGDHFLRAADGSVFQGQVWPGPSVFPDFTRAGTRLWWGELYRPFSDMGAAGFWNDMNEPALFKTPTKTMPLDVVHSIDDPDFRPRVTDQREIHNVYGMLNARATFEGLLAIAPDKRPFVMTRASYAGGHRYAVTWTGDNSSTWNHLRLSTPMLLSLGLGGFVFAGDDLGGFDGSPPADLLTAWLMLGMFNPIARDHTAKGTLSQEPWVHGAEHTAIRRRAIEARYRLLPYIYTLAEEASRTGAPMMRPLFMEFPDAAMGEPLDLAAPGQFMWGADLLVAPPPFGEQPAASAVPLPPGGWYDYWTGRWIGQSAGKSLLKRQVIPRAGVLPVFVRAGAIIPRQPLVQHTGERPDGPLRLDVYPGPDALGSIYQDAGDGFGYRAGDYYRATFRCRATPDGLMISRDAVDGDHRPWWSEITVVAHGRDKSPRGRPATITLSESDLASGVTLPWRREAHRR